MNRIRELVSTLTVEQRIQIFKDYEEFEFSGFIGDCLLRTLALRINKGEAVVMWMQQIAYEVWRSFCMEHLGESWRK